MKILVFTDDNVSDKMVDACQVMITLDEDKKGFTINRHTALSNTRLFIDHLGHRRHISELKHILLADVIK